MITAKLVASFAEAWIEIAVKMLYSPITNRRFLCGSVD